MLASLGTVTVRCVRRPPLSVLVTRRRAARARRGAAGPGAVRDTSSLTISALARRGGAEVISTGTRRRRAAAPRGGGRAARSRASTSPSSAAASRSAPRPRQARASRALGRREVFWGLALKPGSPAWFGAADERSSSVCRATPSRRWSRSCCSSAPRCGRCSAGRPEASLQAAILDGDYEKPAGRAHAVRCRLQRTRRRLARDADRAAGLARAQLDARRRRPGDDPERGRQVPRRGAGADRAAANEWTSRVSAADAEEHRRARSGCSRSCANAPGSDCIDCSCPRGDRRRRAASAR